MQENFKLARERLAVITGIIGEFLGSFIAIVFYWTFFVPFSLISRAGEDPLRRKIEGNAFWLERDPVPGDLEKAKKQG
ncbi:MAG: hypothetical protein AAFU54_11655 [Chloroflexota bacterium]